MKTTLFLWTAFLLCCVSLASDDVRSRQRRMIWPTKNGGFALPTGTRLRVDFGLSGVLSPLTMHLPFTIDFDSLGWTDDENPFGNFFVQRMGKTIGWLFTGQEEEHRRTARSVNATHQPKDFESLGIDRSIVYAMLENVLGKFDVDGKACLLRATCEVHLHSDAVEQYGFAGKTILSFFTSDRSDGPMKDYVAAQMAAKSGDKCHSYFEDCPNSLFSSQPTSKPLKKRTVEDIDPFRLTNNGSIPLTEEDLLYYGKNSTTRKRHFDEIDKTALVGTGEISKKEKKN